MRRKPQTSIRFIAEVSNCSTASVSNVINGKGSVGEETRRRILENIKKYKYKVNRSARSLRTRTSSTIGIVFSPAIDLFQSEFYLNVIRGFHKRISREGFDLMLSETAPDSGVPRFVLNGKADAVAFLNVPVDAKTVRALRGYETPAVVLDAPSGLFDSVSSDGRSAGVEIFSYLDRAGYRSFAFFGLARDGANSETRMAGFVRATISSPIRSCAGRRNWAFQSPTKSAFSATATCRSRRTAPRRSLPSMWTAPSWGKGARSCFCGA